MEQLAQHAAGPAGALLPARHLCRRRSSRSPPSSASARTATATATPIPLYAFPNKRVIWHFLPDMPLRVSALRALGAYANVFSIESFMDDLALEAGADPVEFRLSHLEDPRARDVVTPAAENSAGRTRRCRPGAGAASASPATRTCAAYLAVALEAEVDRETGRVPLVRAVAAIDSGEVVNPDGIRNQTEGGILQSSSWTLYEAVTFDTTRITSIDWASYPILRFGSIPDSVEVHIVDRPGEPFLGTGEAAQGPTAGRDRQRHPAGHRKAALRHPVPGEKVKAAIGI